MNKTFIYFLLIFSASLADAQSYFETLESIGQTMLNSELEKDRQEASEIFAKRIDSLIFNDPEFYEANLKNVHSLSVLDAPDNTFRLLTWSLPNKDKSFSYFGRCILNTGKGFKNTILVDNGWLSPRSEAVKVDSEHWHGAVYYDLIKKKYRKKAYYILLGWNGNNAFSNRKLIEILNVNEKTGEISFGAPILIEKKTLHRKIFEYGEKATMSLKFNEKEDRIVFDHLAPLDSHYKNQFEFYAPDFTYDAFVWKKGKWRLEKNIDARNKELNEGNKKKKPEKGLSPK